MKHHRFLFLILVFSLLAPSHAFCADPGWLLISLMKGDVQVKTPDAADWGLASTANRKHRGNMKVRTKGLQTRSVQEVKPSTVTWACSRL